MSRATVVFCFSFFAAFTIFSGGICLFFLSDSTSIMFLSANEIKVNYFGSLRFLHIISMMNVIVTITGYFMFQKICQRISQHFVSVDIMHRCIDTSLQRYCVAHQ